MKHQSLADIHEPKLVDQLMSDPLYRNSLVGIHGIPSNVIHYTSILMEGLPKNHKGENPEGDIDILLVPPGFPEKSIAIQVKRIKVSKKTFTNGKPNNIGKLFKGVEQANILAGIGFHQVYLFVIVVVDSRYNNHHELITYDGLTQSLNALIDQNISSNLKTLNSRIGFMRFDLIQPMDYAPLTTGASHGHLVQLAEPISQPVDVTEWVKRIIASTTIQATPE